jgi:hypothetical protein
MLARAVDNAESIAAEAAPTATTTDRPIGRTAVLEAIARGKARRAASKEPTER